MSHFSILREATLALREILFDALSNSADVDFGFSDATTDIILSAPGETLPATAKLSLYLYHIEPDPQMRNQPMLARGPDMLQRAPQAVRAFYLISPLLTEEDRNHLMLGRILQVMHDTPFLSQTPGGSVGTSFGAGSPELRLSMEQLRLDELSRIWHAMGSDYRLSVAYMMRSVIIDSAIDPRDAARVGTQQIVVRQGVGR